MSWATPILHSVGDVLTASDWNLTSNDLSYLYASQKLVNAAIGSVPPTTAQTTLYVGSFTASVSAANWSWTIVGFALSHGYTATVCAGDNGAGVSQVELLETSTLTTLIGQAWSPSGSAITGSVRINYSLLGG